MKFDSFSLKKRPDQTAQALNAMFSNLEQMQQTVKVLSKDRKQVIIIGNQPVNPVTGRPYSFGIHTYNIKGDRLEEA